MNSHLREEEINRTKQHPPQRPQRVPRHPDGAAADDGDDCAEDNSLQAEIEIPHEDEAEDDIAHACDQDRDGECFESPHAKKNRSADGAAPADDGVNEHEREDGAGHRQIIAEPEFEEPR